MRERLWVAIAGLSGAAAVIADALAAHLLKEGPMAADLMTGARYGLLHAPALLGVALFAARGGLFGRGRAASQALVIAGWCFAVGLLLFPGSLYLLGAGAPAAWARLAPVGGMLFIAGWVALAVAAILGLPAGGGSRTDADEAG